MGFGFNSQSGSQLVDGIESRVVAVLRQPCRMERRARRASWHRWRVRGHTCALSADGALEGGAKWSRRWSRWPRSRGCAALNGWRTRKGRRRAADGIVRAIHSATESRRTRNSAGFLQCGQVSAALVCCELARALAASVPFGGVSKSCSRRSVWRCSGWSSPKLRTR